MASDDQPLFGRPAAVQAPAAAAAVRLARPVKPGPKMDRGIVLLKLEEAAEFFDQAAAAATNETIRNARKAYAAAIRQAAAELKV